MQNLDETRDEFGFRNPWEVIEKTILKPGNNSTIGWKCTLTHNHLVHKRTLNQ